MKRKLLILTMILIAVTATIGTTSAKLPRIPVAVYVYDDDTLPTKLIFVSNYDLAVASTGTTVKVNITDARPNPDVPVQRKARYSTGIEMKVSSGTTIVNAPAGVVIN